MRAHPLVAILLVVLGLGGLEAMLPVWPAVHPQAAGLVADGADLVDAAGADLEVLRRHGAPELLRAIGAEGCLTVSLLLGLVLAAAWLSRRYLAGAGPTDDPTST